MEYQLVSADSHVNEPPDLWADRVPGRYKDRAPRMESFDQGNAWVLEGAHDPINFGGNCSAGLPADQRSGWVRWEDVRAGGYDPAARPRSSPLDRFLRAHHPGRHRGTGPPIINAIGARDLDNETYSLGMGVLSTARQVGALTGLAVVFGLLGNATDAELVNRFNQVWTVLVVLSALGVAVALLLPRRSITPRSTIA